MSTQNQHSTSPSGAENAAATQPPNNEPLSVNEQQNRSRLPPFNRSDPHQWFNDVEKWFASEKITDSWIKFSLIATTQAPGSYARLQAEVRDFPDLDPYELAREYVLRNNRCGQSDTPARAENVPKSTCANSLAIDERNDNDNVAVPSISTISNIGNTTQNAIVSTVANDTTQSIQQLEAMFMQEIRGIKMDIAEIRLFTPHNRQRSQSQNRVRTRDISVSQRPTATGARSDRIEIAADPEICWYHQTYGLQARLCRIPCRLRPVTPTEN